MALTDLQINAWSDMFEQLELMSSKEKQLEYQENVPIAYVSDELFWGWASAFTDIQNLARFVGIYTSREQEILKALDVDVSRIRSSLPENLPSIKEFADTPKWTNLVELAKKALIDLRVK